MSNKKITDLTELTTPTTDDVFPVVDIATNTTRKVQLGNLPMSSAVTTALATKQDTLVSGTNIKTINGTSVLGSGNIVTPYTPPSGVAGAIQFSNGSAFASDAANLFWDDTNNRLGIGTNAPNTNLEVYSGVGGYISHNASSGYNGFSGFRCLVQGGIRGYMELNPNTGEFKVGADGSGYFLTLGAAGVERMRVTPTGTIVKGSGSTSATTSLLVQNSAGLAALTVTDDRTVTVNGANLNGVNINTSANLQFGNILYGPSFFSQSTGATTLGAQAAADASALLDIRSTTRGFLPPRMTTTQKNAISSPASGLVVYDSTTNKLCCYNGSTWNDLF